MAALARPLDALIRQLANAALRVKSVDPGKDSEGWGRVETSAARPNGLQQELH